MAWAFWDRINSFVKTGNIHQQERTIQDKSDVNKLVANGQFLNFGTALLLDQTRLQINRLARYADYDQMDAIGEISLALDLYADEATLQDPERKHSLVIKAKKHQIKSELENLFFNTLQMDTQIRPMIRYLCKYGDFPAEIATTVNRDGVAALKFLNIYNFTRIETKNGDLVGFYYMDENRSEPQFLHPWSVMHMRLTSYENQYHPYGFSILEGGRKAFKELRLMEDAALIYRVTRAAQKRVFSVPVGNIPAKEIPEFLQTFARQFKNNRFFDPRTGEYNERFSPLIQEDDFFLPVRQDGTQPKIETLEGAENLDQIADIEYFKKKMVAPLKIPFSRVGIGEGSGQSNDKSLSSTHNEFAKAVQWIQREAVNQLTKVGIVHLALGGYNIEDLKDFEVSLCATNVIDELFRMETWGARATVMADLKDLGWFPEEWIISRFTDLSIDEIVELKESSEQTVDGANEGGGGGGGGGGGLDLFQDLGGDLGEAGETPGAEGGTPDLGDIPEETPEEAPEVSEAPEAETPMPESIIRKAEKLIVEASNNIKETSKDLNRLKKIKRIQKFSKPTSLNNPYTYLKENGELDKLTLTGGKHLVESIGNQTKADEAMHDAKKRMADEIAEYTKIQQEVQYKKETEEITESDIPR